LITLHSDFGDLAAIVSIFATLKGISVTLVSKSGIVAALTFEISCYPTITQL